MEPYYYFNSETTESIGRTVADEFCPMETPVHNDLPLYTKQTNLSFFEKFDLSPGFSLLTGNHMTEGELCMRFHNRDQYINISFCLSGTKHMELAHDQADFPGDFSVTGGERVVACKPETSGIKRLASGEHHAMATLLIHPDLLRRIVVNGPKLKSPAIQNYFNGDVDWFFEKDKAPVGTRSVAHQILNCHLDGPTRNLYIRSKALELLALQIADMLEHAESGYGRVHLSNRDIAAVQTARNVLIQDICKTPTVPQLARTVGINTLKLKAGFQRIFGLSIRDYLHKYKMEQAQILFKEEELNVSEAAGRVGYTNVSHFIRAYRKAYGINPGEYIAYLQQNCHLN